MAVMTKAPATPAPKVYFRVRDVAALVGLAEETVLRTIKRGETRAFRFGGTGVWLIPRNELARLMECEPEELPL